MIVAFRAPATLSAAKELPSRILMAKWGRNESVKGPVIVNETTVRALPRLQQLAGFDEVAFDFSHNTVPGTEAFSAEKEPRKVAGFGVPEVVPGEGLFLNLRRWTPEGEEAIRNGHFPDVSPAVKFEGDRENGVVVFCHSCAACRQGAITDLHVFTAPDSERIRQAFATFAAEAPISSMNYKALLCTLLGIDAETATDEQIAAGVKTFSATVQGLATFSTDLANLRQRLDTQERSAITAEALRVGKVVPFGAEIDKLTVAQFKAIVDALPADQVPLGKRTPEAVKIFSSVGLTDDSGSDAVRAALGITKDAWSKHAAK